MRCSLSSSSRSSIPVFTHTIIVAMAVVCLLGTWAQARTIYAYPGNSITSLVYGMAAGDTLVLAPGTYYNTIRISNKNGSPDNWFTIRGPEDGSARIAATSYNNMIELYNSSYWRLENLELDGRNVGSEAFKTTTGYAHHIVLNNIHAHHFKDVCLDTKAVTWDMTISNCHIHNCYVGLYLGNSTGYSQLMNFTFDNNIVEKTSRYNMQIKEQKTRTGIAAGTSPGLEFDSWGWEIKNSVFERTMEPDLTNYDYRPNFLIDAAPMTGPGNDDIAYIHGNVVLGNIDGTYGEHGFQLSGNLKVYNNVIMNIVNSGYAGIRVGPHGSAAYITPRYFEIFNNTIINLNGHSNSRCLTVYNPDSGYTQIVANNAFIRGNTTHVAASIAGGVTVRNNLVRGTGGGFYDIITTAPVSEIFANGVETPGVTDLYPAVGSLLIDAGDNTYAPDVDFNGVPRPRNLTADIGAYETIGDTNPGWQVDRTFKTTWRFGDFDNDGDVDLDDWEVLAALATNPGETTSNPEADLDEDGDCDLVEIAEFMANVGGVNAGQ